MPIIHVQPLLPVPSDMHTLAAFLHMALEDHELVGTLASCCPFWMW